MSTNVLHSKIEIPGTVDEIRAEVFPRAFAPNEMRMRRLRQSGHECKEMSIRT
jgi:hypothetical protein